MVLKSSGEIGATFLKNGSNLNRVDKDQHKENKMAYEFNVFNFEGQLNREATGELLLPLENKKEQNKLIKKISNNLNVFLEKLVKLYSDGVKGICISIVGNDKNSRRLVEWLLSKKLDTDAITVNWRPYINKETSKKNRLIVNIGREDLNKHNGKYGYVMNYSFFDVEEQIFEKNNIPLVNNSAYSNANVFIDYATKKEFTSIVEYRFDVGSGLLSHVLDVILETFPIEYRGNIVKEIFYTLE